MIFFGNYINSLKYVVQDYLNIEDELMKIKKVTKKVMLPKKTIEMN